MTSYSRQLLSSCNIAAVWRKEQKHFILSKEIRISHPLDILFLSRKPWNNSTMKPFNKPLKSFLWRLIKWFVISELIPLSRLCDAHNVVQPFFSHDTWNGKTTSSALSQGVRKIKSREIYWSWTATKKHSHYPNWNPQKIIDLHFGVFVQIK